MFLQKKKRKGDLKIKMVKNHASRQLMETKNSGSKKNQILRFSRAKMTRIKKKT